MQPVTEQSAARGNPFLTGLAVLTCLALAAASSAAAGTETSAETHRVSVRDDEGQANSSSLDPAVSADGRVVAFVSRASNLVAQDSNGFIDDVFVRDRATGTTELVSVSSEGLQGNDRSGGTNSTVAISADGRYVVFVSLASNLVPGDTNGLGDVFVRDRQAGTTERVSVSTDGAAANDTSFFGNTVSISADGRYVAFNSPASNLVAADTNRRGDVFLRDRLTGTTRRVSISSSGTQGNRASNSAAVSANGQFVAFDSRSSNLVRRDTNRASDVFVRDLRRRTTHRISLTSSERQGQGGANSPAISAEGRYIVFETVDNLVRRDDNEFGDVYLRDRTRGSTQWISTPQGLASFGGPFRPLSASNAAVSANGRHVAFVWGLDRDDNRHNGSRSAVFRRDRAAGTTALASVTTRGVLNSGYVGGVAISADGQHVLFDSSEAQFVPGDTNGTFDVFARSG